MDRYLKQLPAGWVKNERGYIRSFDNGSCEVFKADGVWVVLNLCNGAKWAQWYPSFKQLLAAIVAA